MNEKLKQTFTNPRILLLFFVIILSLVAINPQLSTDGVAIKAVTKNSAAYSAGIVNPDQGIMPTKLERILSVNEQEIRSVTDYFNVVDSLSVNETVLIKTNKGEYLLKTLPKYKEEVVGKKNITKVIEEFDPNTNSTINKTVITEVDDVKKTIIGIEDLGLNIEPAPTTNIKKGLDLQGGTRVILEPEVPVSKDDMELIMDNLKNRLNVFGLSDVVVRSAKSSMFSDEKSYIIVEIAGVSQEEVKKLLSSQGKFEAKIGNQTAFTGSDVVYVARSADKAGLDRSGCAPGTDGEVVCRFRFAITLSQKAAQNQAAMTDKLGIETSSYGSSYLDQNLDLYLDDELVDSLKIGADLKGSAVTDISISGSGSGLTEQDAIKNTISNMKNLQSILKSGSLPVKINIVKVDTISPQLGAKFLYNAILVGILAILAVVLVVFIRYRKFEISLPMIIVMTSEVLIILGVAALINWNLDLAAIAGIIIAVGTGVDDQIVIADEVLDNTHSKRKKTWKEKLQGAFFIIFAAYFTTIVAMVPLMFAGAGLVKGFALTTIIGVSIGVFITRPAFANFVEILLKDKLN